MTPPPAPPPTPTPPLIFSYRTQLCNDGASCARRVCFFAHAPSQIRTPPCKPAVPPRALAGLAAEAAARGGRARGRSRGRRGGGGGAAAAVAAAAAAASLYGSPPSTPASSLDISAGARALSLASSAGYGGGSLDGLTPFPGAAAFAAPPHSRRAGLDGGRPALSSTGHGLWAEVEAAAAAARAASIAAAAYSGGSGGGGGGRPLPPPHSRPAPIPHTLRHSADDATARLTSLGLSPQPARRWSAAAALAGGRAEAEAAAKAADDDVRLASLRLRLAISGQAQLEGGSGAARAASRVAPDWSRHAAPADWSSPDASPPAADAGPGRWGLPDGQSAAAAAAVRAFVRSGESPSAARLPLTHILF